MRYRIGWEKQASVADGKADSTIRRLNVFRHFYMLVSGYPLIILSA